MISLKNNVELYLADAGFDSTLYEIKDFNNYVEVFFISDKAIDYILDDITLTIFHKILDIKKYIYENKTSAIIVLL